MLFSTGPEIWRPKVLDFLRALEGYRWLELLEREIAKEPHRFSPRLDDAREVLERFVQHALQHRSGR